MLSISWFNSESDIDSHLWDICFPEPYEGKWWYETLEKCGIEDQFTFMYAVVNESGRPVAIAPAFLMDVPIRLVLPPTLLPLANLVGRVFPSALYQRTLFVGSPCSDEGRVGILPGVSQVDVFRCVNHALKEKAHILGASLVAWKDFPESCGRDLALVAAEQHLFPLVSFPGTVVQLPNSSQEGYLASLKASRRNKLKKKLRLARVAPVKIEVLKNPDFQTIGEIFSLFLQTYEKGTTKFEKLNRRFFDLVSELPHAHFICLREDDIGKMVAFMLCFRLDGHVINKFIGLDYQQPKEWFLYFRLWEAAVNWATSVGARTIQSGQTGYAPKIEIGHQLVPLTNYCMHRNPLLNWIYAKVAKSVNWHTLDEDLAIYLKAYPEMRPVL